MRVPVRFFAGTGLVLTALVLPQNPALGITTESTTGPVRAVIEANQLPAQQCDQECQAHRDAQERDRRMGQLFT
jgi:hypothetical protein